jgi:hypothetical protein
MRFITTLLSALAGSQSTHVTFLICVLPLASAAARAHAQDAAADAPVITYLPRSSAPADPRECKPRFMVGPAMGVVLAPTAIVVGSFMVAESVEDQLAVNRPLTAAGGVTIALSSAVLVYSVGKLVANHRKRRRVCPRR